MKKVDLSRGVALTLNYQQQIVVDVSREERHAALNHGSTSLILQINFQCPMGDGRQQAA